MSLVQSDTGVVLSAQGLRDAAARRASGSNLEDLQWTDADHQELMLLLTIILGQDVSQGLFTV